MSSALPSLRGLSALPKLGASSNYDPVLQRYVNEEEAKSKKRKFQPLRMLFDLLSRPQYVTANIAEEITRSLQTQEPIGQAAQDVLSGIWQGATGQRKGDWEKILFGGAAEGGQDFSGWFPGAGEQLSHPLIKFKPGVNGEERGILRPKKMIGLAANIVMDPTTWIGIGPTKAARSASKQFAEDAAKVALKDPEMGAKIVSAIDPRLAENVDALLKRLKKGTNYTAERFVSDVSKQAGKLAKYNTPDVLRSALGQELTQSMGKMSPNVWTETMENMGDVWGRIAGQGYSGAGQNVLTAFGQKVADVPQGPLSRGWDALQAALPKSATGQKFSDAMWAVVEKGPIGALRRTFGFRNPYQQIAHAKWRDQQQLGDAVRWIENAKVAQIFKDVDENDVRMLQDAMDKTYILKRTDPNANIYDVLNSPATYNLAIDPAKQKPLANFYQKLKQMSDEWWAELQPGISEGAISPVNYVDVYIPTKAEIESLSFAGRATGSMKPGFAKKKLMALEEHVESASAAADVLFGDILRPAAQAKNMKYEDFLAWFVRDRGFSDMKMDLEDMFLARASAQGKAIQRIQMVRDFKQFGIPYEEIIEGGQDLLYGAQKMGLKKVQDPAFANYLFDDEVAGMLDRIFAINNNRESKSTIGNAFKWWTQWWKSVVTLSAGFHVRNWMSNEMTGFIKNGMKNFDPSLMKPTAVGVMYGMDPAKYVDLLSKNFKMSTGAVAMELNKQIGGKAVRDLADYAVDSGVIGWMSQGFDAPVEGIGKRLNKIVGTENPVFRFSKKAGSVIENTAKFKDFLINFEQAVNGGAQADEALAWAAAETKKWFLDYGDITDKEKMLRNIIPFFTWIRKNIANQLSGIMLYPGAYNIIGKVEKSATKDEGFDYSIVPEYFEQQGMFPVGTDPGTGYPVMFRPDFPFKDINLIPLTFQEGDLLPQFSGQEFINDVINSAHPIIKTIMQVAPERGWNFFRRTDVKKQETAPPVFQYFTNKPQVLGFIDGLLRMAGFEGGVKVDMARDNNKVLMDGKAVAIMENHMPALRVIGNLMEMGEMGATVLSGKGEWVEDLVEQMSGKRDYYEGLEDMLQSVTRFGVKFKVLNEDYYGPVAGQKILDKARERKRSDEYNAVTAQTRSKAYQRSRMATLRKYGLQ